MPDLPATAPASVPALQPGGTVRPTIKDVARAAGVHFTTVSMALRGNPRLPLATRSRIASIAARIGYERNEVYSALSRRRKVANAVAVVPTLAYITNQSVENGLLETAHQRRLVHGARAQAEVMGYRFRLLSIDVGGHDSASLLRHLRQEQIGGLILGTMQPNRATLDLPWDEFHIVRIDSRHVTPHGSFISNDQWQDVRLAHQELRSLGYRHIGLAVGATDEDGTGGLHQAAWLLEQSALPVRERVPALLFPPGATTHAAIVPLMRAWITGHAIDAVICNWSTIRSLIRSAGFRVPQQVACACLCLSHPLPSLAGIVSNLDRVGKGAVALLVNLLRTDPSRTAQTSTYVEGTWHPGTSAPPRRA